MLWLNPFDLSVDRELIDREGWWFDHFEDGVNVYIVYLPLSAYSYLSIFN